MVSYCKATEISARTGIVGACEPCATAEVEQGKAWLAMTRRFALGRRRTGEEFMVTRQVHGPCPDGKFLAMESLGSTFVPERVVRAAKFDSELEARQALETT